MLFALFDYLQSINFPGAGIFHYITFRSALTVIFSLIIATIFGKKMIKMLKNKQIKDEIRDIGIKKKKKKEGTPTMGGIIILISILIPVLLFAKLTNVYLILMIITTILLGFIGFLDDYIKVFKKNKKGLAGRFKIIGQIILGLIVGLTLYFNNNTKVRVKIPLTNEQTIIVNGETLTHTTEDVKAPMTSVPFIKNYQFDYSKVVSFLGDKAQDGGWLIYILMTIVIITAVSNGANLTDGLDGLATGVSSIIGVTLGIFAYLSGHIVYADYLNIMYIPNSQELVVFISAFIGSLVGFLWYNSKPAEVFMGDTGSLPIGGIIAVIAILIRIELLLPILCGVFLVESVSVMWQRGWYKLSRRIYGKPRRIFECAPLHHHFEKKNNEESPVFFKRKELLDESKIVIRFWIASIILAVLTIITLKVR
jgi:phospho-N-acetylmuramoyl-pentapeptide-transferase